MPFRHWEFIRRPSRANRTLAIQRTRLAYHPIPRFIGLKPLRLPSKRKEHFDNATDESFVKR